MDLTTVSFAVRRKLYWLAYVLGNINAGLTLVWTAIVAATPGGEVTPPVWYLIATGLLQLATTQLNQLALANMPSLEDAVEGEV